MPEKGWADVAIAFIELLKAIPGWFWLAVIVAGLLIGGFLTADHITAWIKALNLKGVISL